MFNQLLTIVRRSELTVEKPNLHRIFKPTYVTSLLIDCLGRYARFVDHLADRNAAQGAPLGGGFTLHQDKMTEN
jgi:hypothetical protein